MDSILSQFLTKRDLYRLNDVGDGIVVNGWEGHVDKSINDFASRKDLGRVSNFPLYALEYMGNGIVLIGDEANHAKSPTATTW